MWLKTCLHCWEDLSAAVDFDAITIHHAPGRKRTLYRSILLYAHEAVLIVPFHIYNLEGRPSYSRIVSSRVN